MQQLLNYKDEIVGLFNRIINDENIELNDKKICQQGISLVEASITGLVDGVTTFGVELLKDKLQTNILSLINNLNTNVIPYLPSNDNTKNYIASGLQKMTPVYIELQQLLTNILILGNSTKSRSTQSATQLQIRFLDSQISSVDQKLKNFGRELEVEGLKLSKRIEDLSSKIDKEKEKLNSSVNDQLTALRERVETIKNSIESIRDRFNQDSKLLIETTEKDFNEQKKKANEIINLISDSAQASSFGNASKQYRYAKNIWQICTIVFVVLTVSLAILSIVPNPIIPTPNDWIQVSIRVIIAITLGSASAYTARLAHKNFKLEVRTGLVYLDLLTIDSFIKDAKDKEDIKAKLASKYYGRFDDMFKENEDKLFFSTEQFSELLKVIRDIKK